jgi:hypothetical protein
LVKDYQAMINDFNYATQYLPDQRPANAFVLSKAAAYLMLARTYIFRGYSAAKQSSDFQNAYNAAMVVINNQAKYGTSLLQNFADVNEQGNEYNPESLYSVERIPGDNNDIEVGTPSSFGGDKAFDASNDFTPDYTSVKSPTASSSTAPCATRSQL